MVVYNSFPRISTFLKATPLSNMQLLPRALEVCAWRALQFLFLSYFHFAFNSNIFLKVFRVTLQSWLNTAGLLVLNIRNIDLHSTALTPDLLFVFRLLRNSFKIIFFFLLSGRAYKLISRQWQCRVAARLQSLREYQKSWQLEEEIAESLNKTEWNKFKNKLKIFLDECRLLFAVYK